MISEKVQKLELLGNALCNFLGGSGLLGREVHAVTLSK
jgi:hypothetical protein